MLATSSSGFITRRLVRILAPIRPAAANVPGVPLAVTQMGGSRWIGGGYILTWISRPSPLVACTASPRQSARTVSIPRAITSRRSWKLPGASAKSFACHPDANESPTRPPDRLSTTDHSSAQRIGLCRGKTTLPARIATRRVMTARAAPVSDGFG